MKHIKPFLARLSSFLIDIYIVYSISLIVSFLIPLNKYIGTLQVFLIALVSYTVICHISFLNTPGKYLLRLRITTKEAHKPHTLRILTREILLKYSSVALIFFIIKNITNQISSNITIFINNDVLIIISLLFSFSLFTIILIFTKKAWWDLFAGLTLTRKEIPVNTLKKKYLNLVAFLVISFSLIVLLNNQAQNHNHSFLGFKYPLHFKDHIVNSNVNEHVSFIEKQNTSAIDYIFKLFEDNDIVVLCESSHIETTQWDFISEIVHDKRFINEIGHVFTEYGAVSKQIQVDSFLTKEFASDSLRMKEAAKLTKYRNRGFYDFIINLNKLNNTLPDSLKVHEYFTDFDTYHEYIKTSKNPHRLKRDSLMASVVINKYQELLKQKKREKCLVVTNTRHAYGLVKKDGKEVKRYKDNEARYIFKKFPNKTANVLLNCMTKNIFQFYYPVHYGLWDKAFEEINNKPMGFNLKNTPFGEDEFDLFPWAKVKIQYQDVFTGFIFIRPVGDLKFNSYYPFRQYAANQEHINKLKKRVINSDRAIGDFKYNKFKDETLYIIFYSLYNLIPYIFYMLLLISTLLILLINRLKLNSDN